MKRVKIRNVRYSIWDNANINIFNRVGGDIINSVWNSVRISIEDVFWNNVRDNVRELIENRNENS